MPESKATIGVARVVNQPAIDNLGGKGVLPTTKHIGFRNELHQKAFVIAGVTDESLLKDVQALLTKAMEKGIPLDQFKREFKKTIEGRWQPTTKTGEPNTGWRARIIYRTNIRMAYANAQRRRLERMKDTHPFWRWHLGSSKVHRPDHVMRDGMILRADDPWWDDHFPPDGYGCNCLVHAVSRSEMRDLGKTDEDGNIVPDVPPPDGGGRPRTPTGGRAAPDSSPDPPPLSPEQVQPSRPSDEPPAVRPTPDAAQTGDTQPSEIPPSGESGNTPEIIPSDLSDIPEVIRAKEEKKELQKLRDVIVEIAKQEMEATGIEFPHPISVETMKGEARGICILHRPAALGEIPKPEDYKEIILSKEFVKDCLENEMVDSWDGAYAFLVDPVTQKRVKIPAKALLRSTVTHEIGHYRYWEHTAELDKLVYDRLCELAPDCKSMKRILRPVPGAVAWEGPPELYMTYEDWVEENIKQQRE